MDQIVKSYSVVLLKTDLKAPPTAYTTGQPMPYRDGCEVASVTILEDQIDVWGKTDSGGGVRVRLCPVMVSRVLMYGPVERLTEYMQALDNAEKVVEVHDSEGGIWKLDAEPPSDSKDTSTTIVRMIDDGDTVRVIAVPKPGSGPLNSYFFVFVLMPFAAIRVIAEMPLSAWIDAQAEIEVELARSGDEEEEEEEEEKEEEEEEEEEEVLQTIPAAPTIPTPPAIPPLPAPLNGAAKTSEGVP